MARRKDKWTAHIDDELKRQMPLPLGEPPIGSSVDEPAQRRLDAFAEKEEPRVRDLLAQRAALLGPDMAKRLKKKASERVADITSRYLRAMEEKRRKR